MGEQRRRRGRRGRQATRAIQFAHATTAAFAAALVPKAAVDSAAAAIVAADQQPDGSWGSILPTASARPPRMGRLATAFARRPLAASRLPAFDERIARAERWLGRAEVSNVPDAGAILMAFTDLPSRAARQLARGAGPVEEGAGTRRRLGPHTSPAEPFDTAIATLALHGLTRWGVTGGADLHKDFADRRDREWPVPDPTAVGGWDLERDDETPGQTSYAQRVSTTAWVLLALLETRGSPSGAIDKSRSWKSRADLEGQVRRSVRVLDIGPLEVVDLERAADTVAGQIFEERERDQS